jgi:nucleoside-diphosphate-sugar epimerase
VTGGCGFIGARAVRRLVKEGWNVAVFERPGVSPWRVNDIRDRIEIVAADLASRGFVQDFLRQWRPDACLHLAWYAEPGKYLDSKINIEHVRHSLDLLEDLIASGCKNVVMAGTCAEYDTADEILKEDAPAKPATLYAACKLATGVIAQRVAEDASVPLAWARLFYLFGPGEDTRRMAPALIRALFKGEEFRASAGSQVRDYLHVDDVASGLVALLRRRASGVFNVSSGIPTTVSDLMRLIGDEIGRSELIRFGAAPTRAWEPAFICGDSSKLRSLGWSPAYSLRDAVRNAIQYWRSNPETL